jgi:uncharacterized protein (DUF1778 family)
MMTTHTTKRLTIRITKHVQDTLQPAADLVGETLNQFVIQAAMAGLPHQKSFTFNELGRDL